MNEGAYIKFEAEIPLGVAMDGPDPYVLPEPWTERDAMNALQDAGIVSDNCINWQDVGNPFEASAWLKKHVGEALGNIRPELTCIAHGKAINTEEERKG